MREIEFRVWDGQKYHYPEVFEDKTNHYLQIGSNGAFFLHDANGEFITSSFIGGKLEQYTGLKDKNGNKIFEGDILKTYHLLFKYFNDMSSSSYKVLFYDSMICTEIYRSNLDLVKILGRNKLTQNIINKTEFEIIGNIHDNPELLK